MTLTKKVDRMRIPIVAGNWKMNKTDSEATELTGRIVKLLSGIEGVDVVLCPPFTALTAVHAPLKGTKIGLGAQNMHWEAKGAFTGEISAEMLLTSGCRYVILGHSERRTYFGETNESVNRKVRAALAADLTPIVCVGETRAEREQGRTEEVVLNHVTGAFVGFSPEEIEGVVIAYEPVWAIGTGLTATPQQAQEVHAFIRKILRDSWGVQVAERIRIQYGGSVKPENATEIFHELDVDGGLIGGASLEAESFAAIVRSAL